MKGFTPAEAKRHGPSFLVALAISATLFLLPLAVAFAVQITALGPSLLLAMLAGVATSVTLSRIGSTIWSRSTRTGERVFADATLWGWIRVARANRRIIAFDGMMRHRDAVSEEEHRKALIDLADALELRDRRTHGHSRRVTRHSAAIAYEMGLSGAEIAKLRVAAAMHDIGKLHVPAEVLFKPAKLTDEEFALIKQHPVDSAEMVGFTGDEALISAVRHHHERWDGRGYPDGVAGADIPLHSRIIAVADTFDAIVSDRPYRDGVAHRRAQDVIADGAGSQFDPEVAAAFATYYRGGNVAAAWGALSALPPRAAQWITDLLRGGASAVTSTAGSAAASVALTVGMLGGGLPAAASIAQSAGLPVPAVVHSISPGEIRNDDGVSAESKEQFVAESSGPRSGDTDKPGTSATESKDGQPSETGASDHGAKGDDPAPKGSDKPSGSSDAPKSNSNPISDTTDAVADTTKGVSDTVKDVADTVKDVAGENEVTDTVDKTTDTVDKTVSNVNDTVKGVGDKLGNLTGGK